MTINVSTAHRVANDGRATATVEIRPNSRQKLSEMSRSSSKRAEYVLAKCWLSLNVCPHTP